MHFPGAVTGWMWESYPLTHHSFLVAFPYKHAMQMGLEQHVYFAGKSLLSGHLLHFSHG